MKQVIITLFCIALLSACRDEKKPSPPTENKSNDRTAAQADTSGSAAIDLTELILTIIKNQEFYQLAEYIHPTEGIRFSPYGYVDTARDVKLTKLEFVNQLNNPTSVTLWGSFDGSDQPIRLNLKDYVKRFVYDVDFLNAESRTFNHMVATGNTLQNLKSVYPESVFTESYFSGFEEKYDGMDWRSLKLVFQPENGKLYLVGIIHDQWTI